MNTTPTIPGGLVHDMPADLADALQNGVGTVDLWQGLTPIGRNEFICWIESAKQENSRLN